MSRYIFSLFFLNTVLFAAQIASNIDEEIAKLNKEDQLLDQQLSFYQTQNEKMKQIFSNSETELAYLETVEHDMEKLKALFHPNSSNPNEQAAALDELEPELHRKAAELGYPLKGSSAITPLGVPSSRALLNQPHRSDPWRTVRNSIHVNPHLSTPAIIPYNNQQNMAQVMNFPYAENPMNPEYINNGQIPNQQQMMYNQMPMYNPQQSMYNQGINYNQSEMQNNAPQASFWSPLSGDDSQPRLIEFQQDKSANVEKTSQEVDANILRSMSGRGNDNDNTIESMQNAQRQNRGTSSDFNSNDINLLRRR